NRVPERPRPGRARRRRLPRILRPLPLRSPTLRTLTRRPACPHREVVDLARRGERRDGDRAVERPPAAVRHVREVEAAALLLRQPAELEPDEGDELGVLVDGGRHRGQQTALVELGKVFAQVRIGVRHVAPRSGTGPPAPPHVKYMLEVTFLSGRLMFSTIARNPTSCKAARSAM